MEIAATKHTPFILIDEQAHLIRIEGVSIPENAYAFYQPIEAYIRSLDPKIHPKVRFEFRLEYMNSLSSKVYLDFLRILRDEKQIASQVIWEYFSDDEEMCEHGETFSIIIGIPFEYKAVEDTTR
ncbi:MAG: DUF1987 domain-containing protein [Bacteroidia bacterium]